MNNENPTATIMVVDDTPANLKVLEEMLQSRGYRVLLFPRGAMVLKAAAKNPPDLILLDIMMPEMDGFEVCRRLKADKSLKDIPVLFISALEDTDSKLQAFSEGGLDYVTKPFQENEVIARVSVHLKLQRQRLEIKQLLNETLLGAVKALNELLALSCPETYRKNLKIAQYIRTFCVDQNLEKAWMFNTAANLSNLGNIASVSSQKDMKETIFYQLNSNPESKLNKHTFKDTADIVRCIPRLDVVAAMIQNIGFFPRRADDWRSWPLDILGGELLTMAAGFEYHLERGFSAKDSLKLMSKSGNFHLSLLHDFAKSVFSIGTSQEDAQPENERIPIQAHLADLRPGHVLAENLLSKSGQLMLSKGTLLTQNLCMLLEKRARNIQIVFPVHVLPGEELQ